MLNKETRSILEELDNKAGLMLLSKSGLDFLRYCHKRIMDKGNLTGEQKDMLTVLLKYGGTHG